MEFTIVGELESEKGGLVFHVSGDSMTAALSDLQCQLKGKYPENIDVFEDFYPTAIFPGKHCNLLFREESLKEMI